MKRVNFVIALHIAAGLDFLAAERVEGFLSEELRG
jgi:hypothetical protein